VGVDNKGHLIGFVYGEDGNTQVEGAVFKIKNIASSKVLENSKYSKLGVFKLDGIEEGLHKKSRS